MTKQIQERKVLIEHKTINNIPCLELTMFSFGEAMKQQTFVTDAVSKNDIYNSVIDWMYEPKYTDTNIAAR